MAITHLINRRNLCLTILATVLIAVLLGPVGADAADDPDDRKPKAHVMGVIVEGQIVEEVKAPQVHVIRAADRDCKPTEVLRKGVELCKGDFIRTKKNVMLKIAFGDPKDRDEVTIGSPTGESEIEISSTVCGRFCQWFSNLRNRFRNKTKRVAFTNKSTVYLVEAERNETVTLYVFEGEVDAETLPSPTPGPAQAASPAIGPSPAPTAEVVPSPAPEPSPVPTTEPPPSPTPEPSPVPTPEPAPSPAPDPSPAPTPETAPSPTPEPSPAATIDPAATPSPVQSPTPGTEPSPVPSSTPASENKVLPVGPLSVVRFDRKGNPVGSPQRMKEGLVCQMLASSINAEIAINGTPAEIAGDVAKLPNEPDIGERKLRFRQLTCDSYMQADQPETFAELGYIYNDWGNAERALEFLKKAEEKWTEKNAGAQITSWSSWEKIRLNRAIAKLQLGDPDAAFALLNPITTKTDLLPQAVHMRGSINYDKARRTLLVDHTEAGAQKAEELLNLAETDFQSDYRNTSGQLQYWSVNVAQVSKIRGDVARRLADLATDPNERKRHYSNAVIAYDRAIALLKTDRRSENKEVTRLLRARAYVALANAQTANGDTQDALSNYENAKREYNDALKDADTFADVHCGLGSLAMITGESGAARYAQCVIYNPAALVSEVEIPPVVGLRRADAIQTLVEAGLEAEITADGEIVASQDPARGDQPEPQKAKIGSKIKLSLRALQAPTPVAGSVSSPDQNK